MITKSRRKYAPKNVKAVLFFFFFFWTFRRTCLTSPEAQPIVRKTCRYFLCWIFILLLTFFRLPPCCDVILKCCTTVRSRDNLLKGFVLEILAFCSFGCGKKKESVYTFVPASFVICESTFIQKAGWGVNSKFVNCNAQSTGFKSLHELRS